MESVREEDRRADDDDDDESDAEAEAHKEALAKASAASLMAAAAVPPQQQQQPHHNSDEDIDDREGEDSDTNGAPLGRRARRLLFRRLRVGVEDGRVFVGKFHCLDKQGNIILYDTVEFRPASPPSSCAAAPRAEDDAAAEQRSLGLVLIPARRRTSLFVESALHEQFSLLSL